MDKSDFPLRKDDGRADGGRSSFTKDDRTGHGLHDGPIILRCGPSSFGKICRKSGGSSLDGEIKVRMMEERTGQIILQPKDDGPRHGSHHGPLILRQNHSLSHHPMGQAHGPWAHGPGPWAQARGPARGRRGVGVTRG